jgi:hypothetical protein
MSTRGSKSVNRNRPTRLPRPRMLADSAKHEPTKPSKPGFVGFVGGLDAGYAIIRAQPGSRGWSSLQRPCRPSEDGTQPIELGLDCSTKTKRLMSCGASSGQALQDCTALANKMNEISSDEAGPART